MSLRLIAGILGVLSILWSPAPQRSQDPPIDDLLRSLDSEDIAERERASAALLKLGSKAVPGLRKTAGAGKGEAAARAQGLLFRIRVARLLRPRVERVDNPFAPFGRTDHFQVTPDGKTGFGCDLDSVYVWTIPEGRLKRAWRAHPRFVNAMTVSPDGGRLLSRGYLDSEMALWDLATGRRLQSYMARRRSPDQVVVVPGGETLAIAAGDVEWVDAGTGRNLWTWSSKAHPGSAFSLDVSRDGRTLVVACSNDPRLSVLNSKGELVRNLELHSNSLGIENRVHITDDGAGVAVVHLMSGGRLLDLTTGEQKAKAGPEARDTLLGKKTKFMVMAPGAKAPPGDFITLTLEKGDTIMETALTSDERHVLVRTLNGRSITCFDLAKENRRTAIGKDVACFAVDSSGVLTGTRTGEVVLHDLEGKELKRLRHGEAPITLVAFAGASRIVAQGADLVFRCLDLDNGRELWRREFMDFKAGPIRFHPDGRRAFSVFEGPNHVAEFALWNLESGRVIRPYGTCNGFMRGAAVSRDGGAVAVSGRGGFLSVWEVESGNRLWGAASGRMINCLEFTPDGASLIIAGEDGSVERRASKTGAPQATLQVAGPRVLDMTLSRDGKLLVTSGDQGPMSIFDAEAGKKLHEAQCGGPGGFIGEDTVITPFAQVSARTGDTKPHAALEIARVMAIDDTRRRIAISGTYSKRAVIADVEEGKFLGEAKASFLITHVALGLKGTRAILMQNESDGKSAGFAVGKSEPEWESPGWTSGVNSTKGVLFELKNDGMHVFDMKTRNEVTVLKGTVDGPIHVPPGSPYAFGFKAGVVRQLDLETLRAVREMPEIEGKQLRLLDSDPTGDLLIAGMDLFDGRSGARIGKIEVDYPGRPLELGVVQTFFGRDGESIYLVTANGLVITLAPGD